MSPEFQEMLVTWIESGTDAEKRHAAYRLSLPDAVEYAAKPHVQHVYPPLREQLGTLTSAAGRVVSAIVHGQPIAVDQEEQDRRLAICRACLPPEGFWDSTQERCTKCGCFGVFKSWLATERCPIGKW